MAKVDVNFIKPFVDGTKQTLSVMCKLEAKPGKPFFRDHTTKTEVDIAGVIALTSKVFTGTLAISFPEKVFLSVMEAMLGEKFTSITQEVSDGAGELMNVIFGQAKTVLNEKGYEVEKAIPSIVQGKGMKVEHKASGPTIVLPFETEKGTFYIEVAVEGAGLT